MPRSVRSVGLLCLSVLGSLVPLAQPQLAWANTALTSPQVTLAQNTPAHPNSTQSSSTSTNTAKSATAQSPAQPASANAENGSVPVAASDAATGQVGASDPQPPPSPEALAAAEAAVTEGRAAYANGDYVAAEAHFRNSLSQAPTSAAQYGLAMALDLQAKPTEAYDAFTALFALPDFASLPSDQAQSAQQRYSVLKTIPASVVVVANALEAQLEVDGAPQAGAVPFTLRLPAGTHTVRATAANYEAAEVTVEVKPAEQREINLTLKEAVKPAPAKPTTVTTTTAEPAPAPSKIPAYVTLGVAGAAAITGAIFGIQALSAKSDFDKSPTLRNADNVERNALIADMAFGVAFTLGITGVVLLTTDEPSDPMVEQATLKLVPYVSRTSGGAAAQMTW
jgi:hypothetical protein